MLQCVTVHVGIHHSVRISRRGSFHRNIQIKNNPENTNLRHIWLVFIAELNDWSSWMRRSCCSNSSSTTASAGPPRTSSVWVMMLNTVRFLNSCRVPNHFNLQAHPRLCFVRFVTVGVLTGKFLHFVAG